MASGAFHPGALRGQLMTGHPAAGPDQHRLTARAPLPGAGNGARTKLT